jgi:hypothetical protein
LEDERMIQVFVNLNLLLNQFATAVSSLFGFRATLPSAEPLRPISGQSSTSFGLITTVVSACLAIRGCFHPSIDALCSVKSSERIWFD